MIKISNASMARKGMLKLKGKKIQIITAKGKQYQGILYSIRKDYIVIKRFRYNKNRIKTSGFVPVFVVIPFPFFIFPFFF